MNYIKARIRSFGFAFKGIATFFLSQAHAKIHALATLIVVALGCWLGLNATEWAILVLTMAMVWVAEAVNTAIEFTVDLASPEQHPLAGKAKDVAAGAVLLAAIAAVVVAGLVLGPHLWHQFCDK